MCDDDERFFFFFFRLRFDDALTRDLLSLSLSLFPNTKTDVLLEQRDLFARTHQVKKALSFDVFKAVKSHSMIFCRRRVFVGDDSVSFDPRLEKT